MKTPYLLCALFLLSRIAAGQNYTVSGNIRDTTGLSVPYATVALLHPADSTLQFYGISGEDGTVRIKGVTAGAYLLQAGAMECRTLYRNLQVINETDLGTLTLHYKSHSLNEVVITSEKLPLVLKGDTVEYNAGSYRTKPDAVVEELLRKLPGLEVDRAGNIKAQGKQVDKVLVDGKEFFSNDPKLATKNLPADAIGKVQVFDRKSDATQFSGIDDGERNKTINLELKEGKKKGYFGSLQTGAGTDERYKLDAKLYQFRKNSQFALIGLGNNINEAGFSLDDYLDFQGGLGSLMNGGGNVQLRISAGDNLPVNFGQPVYGLIHSGAGGVNYTYSPSQNKRLNVSYLANASRKQLDELTQTRNFTPGEEFERAEEGSEQSEQVAHRLNLNLRNDLDSFTLFSLNGGMSAMTSSRSKNLYSASYIRQALFNSMESRLQDQGTGVAADGRFSLSRKSKGLIPLLKLSGSVNYRQTLSESDWMNAYSLTGELPVADAQFQDDRLKNLQYSGSGSAVYAAGKGYFLESSIEGGSDRDAISRRQGIEAAGDQQIDSLSPDFERSYYYLRPSLSLQQSKKNRNLRLALAYETGTLTTELESAAGADATYSFLLPSLMWRKDMGRGRSIDIRYNTDVALATARQMLPVTNVSDPLQTFTGNRSLRPEYRQQLNLNLMRFDEFTLSSFFFNLSGRYTTDKINWARVIRPDLTQQMTMVNVPEDYVLEGRVEYSTPVRKLGITMSASLTERYNQGISLVNEQSNQTRTFNHELELKFGNRKKDKWDIQVGALINYTDASYSLQQQLNNSFYNIGYFAELSYRQGNRWFFSVVADINSYYAESFGKPVNIPLLKGEAAYYFLKSNRASIILNAFDLLQSNTGLQRISELNYLMEKRSNIIGQYFMLSFKYRLNKSGEKKAGNIIRIGR